MPQTWGRILDKLSTPWRSSMLALAVAPALRFDGMSSSARTDESTQAVEAALRTAARSLGEDVDELAADIFAALVDRLPAARDADPELIADVRATLRETLARVIDLLAMGAPLSQLSQRVHDVAYTRARDGTGSLEDSLLAYEIGSAAILSALFARLQENGDASADAHSLASRRILEFLQIATSAIASAFNRASAARVAEREHDLQRHLEALVGLRAGDGSRLPLPSDFDIDTRFAWCLATVELPDSTAATIRRLREEHRRDLFGRVGQRVVVFSAERPAPIADTSAGVAAVIDGDTQSAYKRAVGAAMLAAHLRRPLVEAEANSALASVLSLASEEQEAYVRARLSGVLDDPRADDLLDTLAAYLRHGLSTSAAARALYVHRHTLDYRLERVQELSGADLENALDRLHLELALFLLRRFP